MPSHPLARLTKKQRKATAFRERGKTSKGTREGVGKPNPNPAPGRPRRLGRQRRGASSGDNGEGYDDDDDHHHDEDEDEVEDDEDANAVPAMEDQDQAMAEMAGDTEAGTKADGGRAAARVRKAAADSAATQKKKDRDGDKRKRSRADDGVETKPATKKARISRGSDEIPPPLARKDDKDEDKVGAIRMSALKDGEGAGQGSETKDKEGGKPQRYILFIGNLKYTTTREAIQNHFSQCDPPPTVRLLTPKLNRPGATVTKSKGCGFLEFSTRSALHVALRMHQSELDGRRINVELTAGGGGKGDARLAKVKVRNKGLTAQRTRRALKTATVQGADAVRQETLQPQRFSTTSGEGEVPRTKRTWTVGDGDQGGVHRGGKKSGKKRGTRTKSLGTGVNALPIG